MLVTKDREYKREVKSDMGFFSFSTKDEGSVDETVQHTEINAGGGLTITTAEGIVVQYKETGNVQEDIAQLAQSPGLEWMAEVASRDDVDWQAIQEVHNQWSESNSGIGGPGMQLVSLAMAVALSATGVGSSFAVGLMGFTEGSSMAVAMAAGFNSLVMQAGMQVVQNGGDIGAALEAMASVETVRSLATAMLTAGLMHEAMQLDGLKAEKLAEGVSDYDKMIANLAQELKEGAVQAGVNAGVGTAVNGGNLGENLVANLRGAAVSVLGAKVANEIGEAYNKGNGDIGYVTHKIAHAALGGAMDLASGGNGISGAIGGVAGEITAEALANEIEESLLSGEITPEKAKRWSDAGVDIARLAAGLAAVAAGGDIDAAADAGGNAAENNAFFTLPVLIAAATAGAEALDKFLLGKDIVDFFVAGHEGDIEKQSEIAEGLLIGAAIEVSVGNIIPGSYAAIKAALKAGDVGLARKLLAKASPEAAEWVVKKSGDAVGAITETFGDTYTAIAKKTGLPQLPGWEGSLSARRLAPGAASHGSNLPRIVEGERWLKGNVGNAGKVPAQIAERLNGRQFKDFNEFRRAFWTEVGNDPVLSKQFNPGNQQLMKDGYAPFPDLKQQVGGRKRYELDHVEELQHGGNVYDMNNIVIRTPKDHILKGKWK
ncbi:DUF637 domain-containing protein [Pseudodesulfovibrio sp. zrk46]|uniref:DUF637 domain-containing protein n=1 Tax=Pseudodesulfovibrio sp. zrk46 TaxID=2725288 RepID=UPI00144939DA|nr:DUF637 domain-containing protein [Pseudodesulfovibrio sp. zrk46]QJB56882.1 DUF637 domain-containing protein [Pseudodesulfovibrio sp. zrk46]